jgi:hypothetical protein
MSWLKAVLKPRKVDSAKRKKSMMRFGIGHGQTK